MLLLQVYIVHIHIALMKLHSLLKLKYGGQTTHLYRSCVEPEQLFVNVQDMGIRQLQASVTAI